jgi:hypothetical protein
MCPRIVSTCIRAHRRGLRRHARRRRSGISRRTPCDARRVADPARSHGWLRNNGGGGAGWRRPAARGRQSARSGTSSRRSATLPRWTPSTPTSSPYSPKRSVRRRALSFAASHCGRRTGRTPATFGRNDRLGSSSPIALIEDFRPRLKVGALVLAHPLALRTRVLARAVRITGFRRIQHPTPFPLLHSMALNLVTLDLDHSNSPVQNIILTLMSFVLTLYRSLGATVMISASVMS